MKTKSRFVGLATVAIALAAQHSTALAQQAREIDIAYSPVATPIPTLSQWALMGLSLLLAAIAVYALRNKAGGKPLASVILVFAVSLAGISGRQLMSEANAIGLSPECSSSSTCTMSNAAGGVVHVYTSSCGPTITVTNVSGSTQKVTSVSYLGGATAGVPGTGTQCTANLSLAQGAACTVADNSAC